MNTSFLDFYNYVLRYEGRDIKNAISGRRNEILERHLELVIN